MRRPVATLRNNSINEKYIVHGWVIGRKLVSLATGRRQQRLLYSYTVNISRNTYIIIMGKRHNRVHPGHFATQQGTPFYPAGMSAADWPTLVFTLPRRKIAWVHPTEATFFQNCTLILDNTVVAENKTLPPAISPAEITLRSRQRASKYTSSRDKHTVRNRHQGPASSSSA